MILSELGASSEGGLVRAQAEVAWEEAEREGLSLFVETKEDLGAAPLGDPNAFLLACLLPAWREGEKRVLIEGALCPVLLLNVRVALSTLRSWYPAMGAPPSIESTDGHATRPPFGQALSFISGGIDSLSTLRWNHLSVPSDHPDAIRTVVPVMGTRSPSLTQEEFEEKTQKIMSMTGPAASDVGVTVTPVAANFWWLAADGYFYDEKWQGAFLSSIACFFSDRFRKAYIGSSYEPPLQPWGSHPMLDNYYSSSYLQIEHHGLPLSRFEKTALVADWEVGLQSIRVCQKDDAWMGNCGECEKCIRTMLALEALERLADCKAFPIDHLSVDLVRSLETYSMVKSAYNARWYRELVEPLRERGRDDLASAVETFALARFAAELET